MTTNDIALTAADYAQGLRALADAIEESGLPAARKYPFTTLDTTLFVSSPAAVHDFAATYGLTVEVSDRNHTRASLVLGPNPGPYYDGSAELVVVHIPGEEDQAEEPEPEQAPSGVDGAAERARLLAVAEECELGDNAEMARICRSAAYDLAVDEPEPAPEPVYLELDGVVMKTTSDDPELYEKYDYGWQQITEAGAMSWRPLDVEPEPVGALTGEPGTVAPEPGLTLPAEAHKAVVDALAAAADTFTRAAAGHELRTGWRVVYVGPDTELSGKHGTVAAERAFPSLEGSTAVGVRFDGHGATWSILPAHLELLDLALHEPGCDCPPHVEATVAAVAADRAARGDVTPSLVQLDAIEETAQGVLDAAEAWLDAPDGDDVGDVMRLADAVRAYRKAAGR